MRKQGRESSSVAGALSLDPRLGRRSQDRLAVTWECLQPQQLSSQVNLVKFTALGVYLVTFFAVAYAISGTH